MLHDYDEIIERLELNTGKGIYVTVKFLETLYIALLKHNRGAWVAQLVKHPTSAHVMISQFVSSSPMSGSVQKA